MGWQASSLGSNSETLSKYTIEDITIAEYIMYSLTSTLDKRSFEMGQKII